MPWEGAEVHCRCLSDSPSSSSSPAPSPRWHCLRHVGSRLTVAYPLGILLEDSVSPVSHCLKWIRRFDQVPLFPLLVEFPDHIFCWPCQMSLRLPRVMNEVRKVTPPDEELKIIIFSPFVLHSVAQVWAGTDGPSPSLAAQTRAGVPWRSGSDGENGVPSIELSFTTYFREID